MGIAGCETAIAVMDQGDLLNNSEVAVKPKGKPRGRPFAKGQSGNPNGRPKDEISLTALLRKEIMKQCPANREHKTWMELVVEATMRLAIHGNATALNQVWERIDGKVKEQVEIEGGLKIVRFPARAKSAEEWAKECAPVR